MSQIVDTDNFANEIIDRIRKKANEVEGEQELLEIDIRKAMELLREISNQITESKNQVGSQMSTWQEQFGQSQENRLNEFNEFKGQINDKLSI